MKSGGKTKPLRPRDFPTPKPISELAFEDLFLEFRIRDEAHQTAVKSRLSELVKEATKWTDKPQPRLAVDRERLKKMRRNISRLTDELEQLGSFGRQALKSTAGYLGPMLSAEWISDRFPDDDWKPIRSRICTSALRLGRPPTHEPARGGVEHFVEELSRPMRHQFVQVRPQETMKAILSEINRGIASAVSLHVDLGGREPLTSRHFFIVTLIDLWNFLEMPISGGPKAQLICFCERVFEIVGWPLAGLDDAVQGAIKHWRSSRLNPPPYSKG